MRIAFISYEYAGGSGGGGIGTYVRNAVAMLIAGGHSVHLFTSGESNTCEAPMAGLTITKLAGERECFGKRAGEAFAAEWLLTPFDVLEGAEYLCDTADAAARVPQVPLVLKLHTPSALIGAIDRSFVTTAAKARFIVGGLLRGRVGQPFWKYDRARDYERENLLGADAVTSPCRAMVDQLAQLWEIDTGQISVIPNVFAVPPALLDIAPDTKTGVVSFFGRLELRKGVLDFAEIIPRVLAAEPDTRFRFVGRSIPHPWLKRDLRELLQERLSQHAASIEWIDGIPYDEALALYAATDICVYPSVWENFPNVCLEAMAAARGVVASSAGGMAEMIEHGRTGLLVPPRSPVATAEAIIALLRDPVRRTVMGKAARERVASAYSPEVILPMQIAAYERAIVRAAARDPLRRNR